MLDFRVAIQFQGNGGDKSLQSLEELKNCRPSLFREEEKGIYFQNLGGFNAKWLVAGMIF